MNEERKIMVEEVDRVDKPAKARVDDATAEKTATEKTYVAAPSPVEGESDSAKLERKRDYLEGFLAQRPEEDAGTGSGDLRADVIVALKEIYDPEIPVNIYDLGLIYGVEVSDNAEAIVTMTLTTPHCPVAESMPGEIELRVGSVPGVGHAEVNLVWDPPWDPSKMTDEAKLELGML
ncbi:SUF system Fe-S cluster assembly protein [Parasphingopyxis algicola]|uniref:SUF system Fe-S cluster assembly protein n=1 Tax=Parasphingopyxis algicola TaxID=2026624 RepID=UPI00159F88BB|nr:SUF system Fe-S cluster assembly protein [Parasphingopyxis algicola]QLC25553.1 SUF system Fe-S cluster assembly protein [Parasphingopyxis algicola]